MAGNGIDQKGKVFQLIQGPLVAVLVGILYSVATQTLLLGALIPNNWLVSQRILPANFITPNFAAITDINVWIIAFTIALVASLETLLCVEATDKIDPEKRVTPKIENLSLKVGNVLSGMIGGLPVTQVIVRSSANIQ